MSNVNFWTIAIIETYIFIKHELQFLADDTNMNRNMFLYLLYINMLWHGAYAPSNAIYATFHQITTKAESNLRLT